MKDIMKELLERYPALEPIKDDIKKAGELMLETYRAGGKILTCGNGGSCSDSDHIVGELMKGFLLKRPMSEADAEKIRKTVTADEAENLIGKLQCGVPAISLTAQTGVISAFANDVDPELVYAQLVFGYARPGDLIIGLSTSGNSANVVKACQVAKAMGMKAIAMTGERESKLSALCDACIKVPATETFKVQEYHLPIYHYLCAFVELSSFDK